MREEMTNWVGLSSAQSVAGRCVAMVLRRSAIGMLLCAPAVVTSQTSGLPSIAAEASHRSLLIYGRPVYGVAFSPDGRLLAATGEYGSGTDGETRIWETRSGREVRSLRSGSYLIGSGVVFHPDGKRLAVSTNGGMAQVWNVETGSRELEFTTNAETRSIAFSPDGRWLASGTRELGLQLFDATSGRRSTLLAPNSDSPRYGWPAVAFSPDGARLASVLDDYNLRLIELSTGRETKIGWTTLTSLSYSPDGRWLAGGSRDGAARAVEVGVGRVVREFRGHDGSVLAVSYSPSGRWLASGADDNTVRIWDAATGRQVQILRGHTDGVTSVAWSPDGTLLLSGSRDGTLRVWLPILEVGVLTENPSILRLLAPKDQFETSDDFNARLAEGRAGYFEAVSTRAIAEEEVRSRRIAESRKRVTLDATAVALGEYDADRRRFSVSVDGINAEIEIAPADAREMAQRRQEIVVEALEQLGSDLTSLRRINLQLVHPTTLRKYPVGPQAEIADAVMVASRPAVLELDEPRFTDTDGDNRLGAGERAVLQFTVRNHGEGPGQGLRVVGTGSSLIDGLSASIGRIEPGESKPVTLTLVGGDSLQDGTAALQLEIREANGFHAAPLTVRVPTLAFRRPVLAVTDVGVEDSQGRAVIMSGQVVTLTVRVQNTGAGRAAGVVADVVPGDGVFLAETSDPRRAILRVGDVEAGAFVDVRVKAFANAEVRERFPLTVALREGTGRFASAARDLGLVLQTPQRSVAQLEVSARSVPGTASSATAATVPRLASDLLEGIPTARSENPEAIAVIIGNRSYQNAPGVAFATNDASVMRQYAERALGIRPGNVIYLEDATLTNLQVVFGREGDASGRLRDLVKPGVSEVFVFYSGHGAPDARARRAYLMPVDADASRLGLSGFSVDVLYANLAALGAKHVTVVLDACFSGATGGGEMLITEASPIGIQVTDPAARFAGGSATIFTAAGGQQLSNWYPERRHGLFTYFFLKGLQGSADADGDGAVTLGEMRIWLTDPTAGVPYESRRLYGTNREQVPQVWGDSARRIR